MRIFVLSSISLCLISCAGCTTTNTVVAPKTVKLSVPPTLIEPCQKPDRRKWPTVKDIVATANTNEAQLKACSAQVDGVRAGDQGPQP
ncbi:MAG: Rz1-like lysis system protein LysC [Rhizobiaceae bacterium]